MQIDFSYYLDYRKDMQIKAKTFFILYKDNEVMEEMMTEESDSSDLKSLIIGPMKSKRSILTQNSFYNLKFDRK